MMRRGDFHSFLSAALGVHMAFYVTGLPSPWGFPVSALIAMEELHTAGNRAR